MLMNSLLEIIVELQIIMSYINARTRHLNEINPRKSGKVCLDEII